MIPFLLTAMLLSAAPPQEPVHYPTRPGPREFLLDEAKLVSPQEGAEIRRLCEQALTEKKVPIIVVTIPSLASQGAGGWPIERYAMNLMAEWGVGWADWNYGMLLLVSPGDRKARIELGGSWARDKDEVAQRVMSEMIVPRFKQGDFGKGILEGVRGLQAIALDAAPKPSAQPRAPMPSQAPNPPSVGLPSVGVTKSLFGSKWGMLGLGVLGIIVLFVISKIRRGVTSWGSGGPGNIGGGGGGFGSSLGGGLLGGALGSMIYNAIARRGSGSSGPSSFGGGSSSPSSGGGSFSGGSFGGGFSGGGGATGSW